MRFATDFHELLNVSPYKNYYNILTGSNDNSSFNWLIQVYKSDTEYIMDLVFKSGILSTARQTIGHGPSALVIYDVSH